MPGSNSLTASTETSRNTTLHWRPTDGLSDPSLQINLFKNYLFVSQEIGAGSAISQWKGFNPQWPFHKIGTVSHVTLVCWIVLMKNHSDAACVSLLFSCNHFSVHDSKTQSHNARPLILSHRAVKWDPQRPHSQTGSLDSRRKRRINEPIVHFGRQWSRYMKKLSKQTAGMAAEV